MDEKRVTSDIFVGRKEELKKFEELLLPTGCPHILSIHTNGDGGIGKTQLLLQMQKICESRSDVIYTKKLIDFYHTEARTGRDVMRLIAEALGKNNFPEFNDKLQQYENREIRKSLFVELESAFHQNYADFAEKTDKIIVLFFDTYEVIQNSDLSRWLEIEFFPTLKGNTRVIVAGRYPLKLISADKICLATFQTGEAIEFLKKCFHTEDDKELEKRIGSNEFISKINEMAKGRPILLALFADWCQYEHNIMNPVDLIKNIESQTRDQSKKQELFETSLIERIAFMKRPEDMAVTYMAFAYRRMTPDIFGYLTDISIEKSKEILLEKLKPLSFIKYKEEDTVLLHDEMRDLVVRYWWKKQDARQIIRKDIAENLVEYYNKLLSAELSETEQAVYYAEKLYYQLYTDLEKGFDFFVSQFDESLQEYRIYFCDLLIQEIQAKQFYTALSPEKQLEIDIRRVRYYHEQSLFYEAFKVIRSIEYDINKKEVINGDKNLLATFRREQGIVHVWLNEFNDAVSRFKEASEIFNNSGDKYDSAWSQNWLGYLYYRNSNFKEAHRCLTDSRNTFLELDPNSTEKFYERISNVYSNINLVFRYMGRYYEAANCGEVAVGIAKKIKNDWDHSRFLIALGETYTYSNKTFEAFKAYEKACLILNTKQDNLLKARVFTKLALLSYSHSDYIYLLESYLRGEERKEALDRFHQAYLPNKELQLKKAEDFLNDAKEILTKKIQPTIELAELYYYYGQYYTVKDEWDEAIASYKDSENIARKVRSEYREINAIAGQIIAYYFKKKNNEDFESKIQECMEKINQREILYYNLKGKIEIIQGNIAYEKYIRSRNYDDLKEAFRIYVSASDCMLSFGNVSLDRFHSTFQIVLKRMGRLPIELLPSSEHLDSFREIWNIKDYCSKYCSKFDEIIVFMKDRIKCKKDKSERKRCIDEYYKKAAKCLNEGKEDLCFAPIYREMSLCLLNDSDASAYKKAAAYHRLSHAYFANDRYFEAHKNAAFALDSLKKDKEDKDNNNDKLLKARILIRFAKTSYRREQYAKTIEFYRRKDFKRHINSFKEKNRQNIDKASHYFEEARKIFDEIEPRGKHKKNFSPIEFQSFQSIFKLRLAEYTVIIDGDHIEIERLFNESIKKAESGQNISIQINAIESLITYYYVSGQWAEKKGEIEELRKQFRILIEEKKDKNFYGLKARFEITEGNVKYDQIVSDNENLNNENLIEETFRHYTMATSYRAKYSYKLFYETISILLDRIAKLPKISLMLLHGKIYPRLKEELKLNLPAEDFINDAYQLVEQCLDIHSGYDEKQQQTQ